MQTVYPTHSEYQCNHKDRKVFYLYGLLILLVSLTFCTSLKAQLVSQNGQVDLIYNTYTIQGQTNALKTIFNFRN
ncbi:hypothetical protein [Ulvibacterium marinum]|uniref:hypothetical protein n=1 Tax=Ulvibacterium marinum TaxID=2419782 RepID=UPI0011C36C62|nr:hypothetical protein [Ulvibacterium marinum]